MDRRRGVLERVPRPPDGRRLPPGLMVARSGALTASARGVPAVRGLAGFLDWMGAKRVLTHHCNLTLADAAELAVLLGTGEVRDPVVDGRTRWTNSSVELPEIDLVFRLAGAIGLYGRIHRRIRPATTCEAVLTDPLPVLQAAVDTLIAHGVVAFERVHSPYVTRFLDYLDDRAVELLLRLHADEPLTVRALVDGLHDDVEAAFHIRDVMRLHLDVELYGDLAPLLARLAWLGLVVVDPAPGQRVRLTLLGRWWLGEVLTAAGWPPPSERG